MMRHGILDGMEGGTRMTTESDSLWCETGRSFDKNETLKAKGIAICLLLFHHLFFNKARVQNGGIHLMFLNGIDQLNAWGTDARVCVWMFAFLSAYGLSLQYRKREPADSADRCRFVGHYWLSLMKPYWFVFVLQLLLSFFLFKPPSAVYQGNWFYPVVCFFGWSDLFQTPMPSAVWWYMCFAQIVVLMVPFLYEAIRKFGILVLPLSFIAALYFGPGIRSSFGGPYVMYLFVVVLGVWFAQKDVMAQIGRKWKWPLLNAVEGIAVLAGAFALIWLHDLYHAGDKWWYTKLFMSCAAVLIVVFGYKYLRHPVATAPLKFLGRHSGNIFLIHSFLYTYYLNFVFFSHNVLVTFLTLLLVSLALSMAIEALKGLLRRLPPLRILL